MATCNASLALRERFLHIVIPVFFLGVLADQASKSWASVQAAEPRVLVPGYLAAYSVENAGMILGLGDDRGGTAIVFAVFGIGCAALLIRRALADQERWRGADCLAGALVLAGILGNTVDRLALGYVRDFLVTRAVPTLAFNVADLLVIAGGACLLMARACDRGRALPGPGLPHGAAV